jgi:CBS domain-containing protein
MGIEISGGPPDVSSNPMERRGFVMKNLLVKDWMSKNVFSISPDTPLPDVAVLMREKRIRRMPVVNADGVLVGIVSHTDVVEARPSDATTLDIWEMNYLLAKLKVSKIMTPNPLTVRVDSTIKDAAQLMYDHKVGGLPVVDESGHVVGIITESDIFRVLIAWFNEQVDEKGG